MDKPRAKTPYEKFTGGGATGPGDLIAAKCWRCMGGPETGRSQETIEQIRSCDSQVCYLHPRRPYQNGTRHLPVLRGEAGAYRNPMEKLSDGKAPVTSHNCIKAQCWSCVAEKDRGIGGDTRLRIKTCPCVMCPIHERRPYR